MKNLALPAVLSLGILVAASASAQTAPAPHKTSAAQAGASATPVVQVQNAWVRATVPGQKVAAAYMQLQALQKGVQLVGLQASAAPVVQIHNMQMQGDVMRMFEVKKLDLAQGQAVNLQSGGLHIMLMDLPQALTAGSQIALTLRFADGQSQTLNLPVLAAAPSPAAEAQTPAAHTEHSHH
jgi:hypothetical protein